MSSDAALGFGGFLVGLGLGWVLFSYIEVSFNIFAWLLIIIGAAIIVSRLISWGGGSAGVVNKFIGGFSGGLIIALFLTSGISLIQDISGNGGILGPYNAEDHLSFSGVTDQDRTFFECNNFNGRVTVSTWDKEEYNITLRIRARGDSTREAQELIDDLDIQLNKESVEDQLRIVLDYDIPLNIRRRLAIDVMVNLPRKSGIGLDVESSNGAIELNNIQGGGILLDTSNGAISLFNVYGDSIDGSTSNGLIEGVIEASMVNLRTSNGRIEVELPGTESGEYTLDTSNGRIEVSLRRTSNVGFEIDASTSNGNIDLNLHDLDYSTDTKNRKVARTTGFEDMGVKITIKADTSNGNIEMELGSGMA
jgi:hypothetical protein